MIRFFPLISCMSALLAPAAYAHPVAYKDAFVVRTMNAPHISDYHINYSFTPRSALGITYRKLNHDTLKAGGIGHQVLEADLIFGQINFLAKRWNLPRAQGNLYLWGGGGGLSLQGESRFAWNLGIQADYETRRIYMAAQFNRYQSGDFFKNNNILLRAGAAPFLAPYKKLHIWMLGFIQYDNLMEFRLQAGPILRFFYHNVFWELGASFRGNVFLNTMIHI